MKIKEALKSIIKKGKVNYGKKETLKSLKEGNPELVVIAENAPKETKQEIKKAAEGKTEIKTYPGSSLDLGEACKRPHLVSTLAVEDSGKVRIQRIED